MTLAKGTSFSFGVEWHKKPWSRFSVGIFLLHPRCVTFPDSLEDHSVWMYVFTGSFSPPGVDTCEDKGRREEMLNTTCDIDGIPSL